MERQYIVFTSEYGSGARLIARKLAETLNIPFYGEEDLLIETAKYLEIDTQVLHNFDQYGEVAEIDTEKIIDGYKAVILNIVRKGPCILMERGADYILRDVCSFLNVYVYAPNITKKIERAVKIAGQSEENAKAFIQQQEQSRAAFYQQYTDITRAELSEYDLCINSDTFTGSALDMSICVDIIKSALQ
ncbi:cytidylate kinase-like family protein [Staphylococcus shinii]|uniref:Cytidylate kinase-like family protein n=1 Tax=Staphylococcus shinii TaxID=2912228 RepID=A0A418IFG3_9STAP|nr:cytidylate kinase-like family protein [Staphylococcus shinii]MDW8563553.1 cytidylate kinase-like family protein [Staphylococcus shinii]MDW8566793.1 cytidylate kinase-like family protein [Staphylococcus shinii]MDW8569718.1 cytidylate kinase-like family protein [Staphylococcus shinii]MDW8571702.1 cytidylate kinase-like family protein [Staphylococcus shinii]RIN00998.1 cytidylate kinase-like family protein [Staphylococcus shinii]